MTEIGSEKVRDDFPGAIVTIARLVRENLTFHRFFGHQRAAPYAACLADCCFNQVS
jgi:hypothetical protein